MTKDSDSDDIIKKLSKLKNQWKVGSFSNSWKSTVVRISELEDSQKKSKQNITILTTLMIWVIVIMALAIVWWLVDTFWRLSEIKKDFYETKYEFQSQLDILKNDYKILGDEVKQNKEDKVNNEIIDSLVNSKK